MEFRQVGEALDGARRLGIIGSDVAGKPIIDARGNETADGSELVERAAPADTNEGTGARSPRQVAAREGGSREEKRRVRLVVIRGGLAASSAPPRKGVTPARAVGLHLITLDGKRVGHAALAKSP